MDRQLAQEIILDHGTRPRNRRPLERCDRSAEGNNPLCRDRVTVRLALDGDRIERAAFEGEGCAISQASASLMTEAIEGKTLDEVRALGGAFRTFVRGEAMPVASLDRLRDDPAAAKLTAFESLHEVPLRVKCATLAWHTLEAALDRRGSVAVGDDRSGEVPSP